jgi:hypothetical protein
MEKIRRERALNGGQAQVPADLQLFLIALSHPDEDGASSVSGSPDGESGNLLLTTENLADRWGCSTRWARHRAAQIGTKVGRQWLVAEEDLDERR